MSDTISPERTPHAYSVAMLARRWGRSPGNIYGMIKRDELKSFRIGKLFRILASEVARVEAQFSELGPQKDANEDHPRDETEVPAPPALIPRRETRYFTLAEAASRLRIGSKTLRVKLSEFWHTRPVDPLHARTGSKIIISEDDLRLIYEALKERPHTERWPTMPPRMSEGQTYARAMELASSKRLKKK